ncbi:MAG: ABC transporter permease, partial [Pseudomonadales bacterium]|nr:ABC transporter permease [Pseudomonadales bacterium]
MTLSPMNQRRFAKFRGNKRGWYSLWIFTFIFILTLFADFIANDKPVYINFDGGHYFPVFKTYSELEFGGEFETEADYRDEYVIELIEAKGFMVNPIIKFSYDTINWDLPTPAPSPPDDINLLGTDDQGRDVLARTIYGFRISVLFGLSLTIFSSIVGVFAGAIQGYYGGWVDMVGQRFIEIWSSLPPLFLLIILSSLIQ